MTNGQIVNLGEHGDACPMHEGEIKKVYEFGSHRGEIDAEVTVFFGCSCATVAPRDGFGEDRYFDSYEKAAGVARLIKAKAAAW